jgi:hypothetical protein
LLFPAGAEAAVEGDVEYVDSVARFQGRSWGGLRIAASDIQSRALTVAIPDVSASAAQWNAMYGAYQYGLQQRVSVQYVVVTSG